MNFRIRRRAIQVQVITCEGGHRNTFRPGGLIVRAACVPQPAQWTVTGGAAGPEAARRVVQLRRCGSQRRVTAGSLSPAWQSCPQAALGKAVKGSIAGIPIRRQYQEFLDWRKWTNKLKGGCSFPFLSAQF